DLGQLAAAPHAADRQAVAKRLLRRIRLVIAVLGRLAAQRRGILDRNAVMIEHLERMGDFRKEEAGLALVRPDLVGIRHDEQDMPDAHRTLQRRLTRTPASKPHASGKAWTVADAT